jgi:hypothetical protein
MTPIRSTIYKLRKFSINCTFNHLLQLRTRWSGVRQLGHGARASIAGNPELDKFASANLVPSEARDSPRYAANNLSGRTIISF